MAALLELRPASGASSAACTVARLSRLVDATVRREVCERPRLLQLWEAGPDGCLACHWEIAVPPDIPIPPD